jgi:RNA polymerase sigma-70 factor (ECF subfamily)
MDKEVEVLTRNTLLQIFRDKITALQSAAKKHLGNEHDADDIIHDALINILELDQQRFASINNPEAFLYTMVKNLSIDRHRKNSKAPERIYTEPDQFTASQNEPDRLLYAEQKKRLLKQALNELPLACRQAFVLHRYKNIPQKVIAAEMNLSLNSVERYIIKAHRHCQQRLQQGEQ